MPTIQTQTEPSLRNYWETQLKITKQQSSFEPVLVPLTTAAFGKPVRTADGKIIMRLKPVNFLLNSTLIVDIINRGKVLVADLEKGTVYVTEGDKLVQLIEANLTWSEN